MTNKYFLLTEMLKQCLGLFFMLFAPREKNIAFYEERSKKAIFKNRHPLFSFEKIHMKGDSFVKCSKVSFKRSSLKN